jgi:glycosyltransferase involved in cell wall biosynthesis
MIFQSRGNNDLSFNSLRVRNPALEGKKKVLVWSDSVLATTGFGRVSKYILDALHKTGQYEIDQLAINFLGSFYDREKVPYCIQPAKLGDPNDPYGNQMFIDALQRKEYDIVFIINDTYVVEGIAKHIDEIREIKKQKGLKPFHLVYYYPVDCRLLADNTGMIKAADKAVTYTEFAHESSCQAGVEVDQVIYHGTDVDTFRPLSISERQACRAQYLKVDSDDTFVLINVNRNSPRKALARTILAFHHFRKDIPNSKLYIHAKLKDSPAGIVVDLGVVLNELGFNIRDDVVFPNRYSASRGFPSAVLNQLYNCADAYITTNLGEGWGLTITEAMACQIPVIAPDHTSAPEILGDGRGYLIPCKEQVYIDNSGFRPMARMEDILEAMHLCYAEWKDNTKSQQEMVARGREFVELYSWKNVCKEWVSLFQGLKPKENPPGPVGEQL